MEIIRAKHMGFCFGVAGAIDICHKVLKEKANENRRVFILGMLVHNENVVEELKQDGFRIIEEEDILSGKDDLGENDIVIIRAHGTTQEVYCALSERKVKIYDATCVFVAKIRKTLVEMEKEGYNIVFIGDRNHPEVKGIISFGKNVQVCADLDELKKADIKSDREYCLLTQTTLNKKSLEKIKSYLENQHSNVKILDKICGATQVRQEAVEELAKVTDVLIVVGGKNSSNTKKLYEISKSFNPDTYLIQDESGLNPEWLKGKEKIGITAGASTPEKIVINIENKIRGIFNA